MKKRIFSIVFVCVMIASSFAFASCAGENSPEELPITYAHATYIYDITDLQKHIGYVDYVFVGYIENQLDMFYRDNLPFQKYDVKVLENIKGELMLNKTVEIQKLGGLAQDKKSIILLGNDFLPEKDNIYIFLVTINEESQLVSACPYTVIPLESGINAASMKSSSFATVLSNSDVLQKYIDAYENEITYERERTEYIQQD